MVARALSVCGAKDVRPCVLCSLAIEHQEHRIYVPIRGGFETGTLWQPVPHDGPCGRLCANSHLSAESALPLHQHGCEACAPISRWFR